MWCWPAHNKREEAARHLHVSNSLHAVAHTFEFLEGVRNGTAIRIYHISCSLHGAKRATNVIRVDVIRHPRQANWIKEGVS